MHHKSKYNAMTKKLFLSVLTSMAIAVVSAQVPTDIPFEKGKFEANWNSLEQWDCPEWFKDAKFGIWAHWGPQCQAESGDWYGRYLYFSDNPYDYHRGVNFNPSEYGMKDFCHDWKAENWDPKKLIQKYKAVGCKYFMTLGNHHDNFDLWDSPYQEWNSVDVGPMRDICGEWAEACREVGLPIGVSIHASHAWSWFEIATKYDAKLTKADGFKLNADGTEKWWKGLDPQELYAQGHSPLSSGWENSGTIHSQWGWENGASIPDQKYKTKLQNRCRQLVNDYRPDMIYFDDTVLPFWGCDNQWGQDFLAYYYNHMSNLNEGGDPNVLVCGKILPEAQKESMLWDVERGIPDRPQEKYWQTCTCIGGWHYSLPDYWNGSYKSAETVIRMLIDIVSKNGNLLLSIPLRADGTYDEKEAKILDGIQAWMEINGESIYGTRVWKCFGEGPLAEAVNGMTGQGFNEGQNYTSADVRYVHRNDTVYATIMAWPEAGEYTMKAFSMMSKYYSGIVEKVTLLGYGEVEFSQTLKGLTINVPSTKPNAIAPAFRITLKEDTRSEAEQMKSIVGELDELTEGLDNGTSYINTGKYNTIKVQKLKKAIEQAKKAVKQSGSSDFKTAKEELIAAYSDFEENGKNAGGAWKGTYEKNVTVDKLVEANNFTRSSGGTSRFGAPKNWTVENFNIPNGGDGTKAGLDNYSGKDALMLGVWNDAGSNNKGDLSNARIYRKVRLEKGIYYFGAGFNAAYQLSSQAYMFVSKELCNTADIPEKSLAYLGLAGLPNDLSVHGLWVSIPKDMDVYVGFQVNLKNGSSTQEFRAEKVVMYKLPAIDKTTLTQLTENIGKKLNTLSSKLKPINTGYYNPGKFEEMQALTAGISAKIEEMAEEDLEGAYYSLSDAWEAYQTEGKNKGGIADSTGSEDITIAMLKEVSQFSRKDSSVTTRFATPLYWSVENFKIPNGGDGTKNGLDKYSGQDALMLGIWDDRDKNQQGSLTNARIYQKVTLEPGVYYFGASFNANYNLYAAYMYVGEKLIATSLIPTRSVAYYDINEAPISTDQYGLYFLVEKTGEYYICFQANLSSGSAEQEFRAETVSLLRYDIPTSINEALSPQPAVAPQGIFTLDGIRHSKLQKGINIVNGKKVLVR